MHVGEPHGGIVSGQIVRVPVRFFFNLGKEGCGRGMWNSTSPLARMGRHARARGLPQFQLQAQYRCSRTLMQPSCRVSLVLLLLLPTGRRSLPPAAPSPVCAHPSDQCVHRLHLCGGAAARAPQRRCYCPQRTRSTYTSVPQAHLVVLQEEQYGVEHRHVLVVRQHQQPPGGQVAEQGGGGRQVEAQQRVQVLGRGVRGNRALGQQRKPADEKRNTEHPREGDRMGEVAWLGRADAGYGCEGGVRQ